MPLTKVTNGNWAAERARKNSEGRFIVGDATRFYDVHMEVGVKLGTTNLVVLVHHETSPYIVESKLMSTVDSTVAENYRGRRRDFIEEFHKLCAERREEMPGFELTDRWMLIGSVEYDFAGRSVEEVSKWLAFMIDEIADKITSTTNKLDARARFIAENDVVVIDPSATLVVAEANSGEASAIDSIQDDSGEVIDIEDDAEEYTEDVNIADERAEGSGRNIMIPGVDDVPFGDTELPFPAES